MSAWKSFPNSHSVTWNSWPAKNLSNVNVVLEAAAERSRHWQNCQACKRSSSCWGCTTLILSVLSSTTHWNQAFQNVHEEHPTIDQLSFQSPVNTYAPANERTLSRTSYCKLANHKHTTIGWKACYHEYKFSQNFCGMYLWKIIKKNHIRRRRMSMKRIILTVIKCVSCKWIFHKSIPQYSWMRTNQPTGSRTNYHLHSDDIASSNIHV